MQFAGNEITLAMPQSDGASLRQHLMVVQRACNGRPPKELIDLTSTPCPAELRHLWDIFWELRSGVSDGFGVPQRISYSELHAWMTVTRTRLPAWQIAVIKRLDAVFLDKRNASSRQGSS